LSFERVVELFEKRETYLAHPSRWEDPYESRLRHKASDALFAQCWSKSPQSDAMWRIYSPDRLSLRIRTTRLKLRNAIKEGIKSESYKMRLKDVEYLRQIVLNDRLSKLAVALEDRFTPSLAADALQWKRLAFQHENEVRLVVYRESGIGDPEDGLRIKVDPFALIDDILIDPRAPRAYVEAFKLYLKHKIKFTGHVARSLLYAEQKPIEVFEL